MSDDLKHACHECGGNIAYPQHAFGVTIHCPHCGEQTTLGEKYANKSGNESQRPQPEQSSGHYADATDFATSVGAGFQPTSTQLKPIEPKPKPKTLETIAGVFISGLLLFRLVAFFAKEGEPPRGATPSANLGAAAANGAPDPGTIAEMAELEAYLADSKTQIELMRQLEDTDHAHVEMWNRTIRTGTGGAAQLQLIRDRIIPLVRETKGRVERFQPKSARAQQIHRKMLELMTHDMSSWIAIHNAASAGDWQGARALFDRRELDRKAYNRQLVSAIEGN